ncbi:MAG: sigma-70 family RNA polymerase sigma factor, partial [Planctomycetota bacterium]|nr:sigma-70 family RNA polymerase sigma factor [Planctomycetota bacterium]
MNTAHHDELLAEMGWVRGLARRLLLDASRADDAAQEALTRALSQPARSPRRGPALRAFLATATRVIARDQRRSDRRRVHRERTAARGEALVSTLETVERRAAVRSLVEAVEALDEPYRSAVRLRYLEQHSVAEVAAVTDAQPVTVRKRVSRGLAMLRGRLAEQHEAAHHEAGSGAWAVALLPFAGPLPELHHGRQLARLAALLVAGLGSWVALERVVGSELEAPPTPNRTLV